MSRVRAPAGVQLKIRELQRRNSFFVHVNIETKTKIEFVNELQARVVLPSGEAYIVSFPSTFNYSSGGHFIKTAEAAFDFKMVYSHIPISDAIRKINAELYSSDYEMIVHVAVDLDKGEERKRIGNRIKELRKKNNVDAKTLASRVGIDASNLSRIEQGHYSVGFDILSKIANYLGARIDLVEVEQKPNEKL